MDDIQSIPMDDIQSIPMEDLGGNQAAPRRRSSIPELKNFDYRFMIIFVYCVYSSASFCQLNQFTIIQNVIEETYKINGFDVHMSHLVFLITLIIFVIPAVHIIERYDLRCAALLCSWLTFAGAVIKLFIVIFVPEQFYYIVAGQFICGIAQVLTVILPAKVVAVWFAADVQNRACAVALFGVQIGIFLGSACPILFVHDQHTDEEVKRRLYLMLIFNTCYCFVGLLGVIFFYIRKPPRPASFQQHEVLNHRRNYYRAFLEIIVNSHFLLVVALYGTACGMWSVFGLIENMIYLHYFPDSLTNLLFIITITSISGGMIGNYLFGYILDNKLKYKIFTFLNFVCITVSYTAMAFCLEMRWHWPSYITMIWFGIFSSCSMNISIQYIVEVTFPVSEVVPIALLQVIISLVTVAYGILFNLLLTYQFILTFHWIIILTFILMTSCTYFLSSNLKRMTHKIDPVEGNNEEDEERDEEVEL